MASHHRIFATGATAILLIVGMQANIKAADPAEEVKEIRSNFYEQAREAREEYRNELRRHARIAVSKLEKVASAAVREGNLAASTNAMKDILWLDRENRRAIAHFKAIGTLDEVLKELEEKPALPTDSDDSSADGGKLARALVGTTWSWGSNITITFGDNGLCKVSNDPNPRSWFAAPDGTVHVASRTPLKYYAVVKMDDKMTTFTGAGYEVSVPSFSGQRLR